MVDNVNENENDNNNQKIKTIENDLTINTIVLKDKMTVKMDNITVDAASCMSSPKINKNTNGRSEISTKKKVKLEKQISVKSNLKSEFVKTSNTFKRKSIQVKESNSYSRQRQIEHYKAMATKEDRKKRYILRKAREIHSSRSKIDHDYPSCDFAKTSETIYNEPKHKKTKRVTFSI